MFPDSEAGRPVCRRAPGQRLCGACSGLLAQQVTASVLGSVELLQPAEKFLPRADCYQLISGVWVLLEVFK